ncbi:hypothetical protein [Streptomyces sp. NPDC047014]|uniref:hypothetical protein n=1 Tax=Streptomyces sp. NPDC047014 TaxID=3155736 RepID=UPI0033DB582E
MTSLAERHLLEHYGWPIEEEDFGRHDEPEIGGCALLAEVADGVQARFVIRPNLDAELRAMFAEWSVQRVERFLEHGPEPDGWQRTSAGHWQLWTRLVSLPPL